MTLMFSLSDWDKPNPYPPAAPDVLQAAPGGSRCPICGATGFRAIRRVSTQLIFECRRGHPYLNGRVTSDGT